MLGFLLIVGAGLIAGYGGSSRGDAGIVSTPFFSAFSLSHEPFMKNTHLMRRSSQGGSIHKFTNDILDFHEFTNDGESAGFTIS